MCAYILGFDDVIRYYEPKEGSKKVAGTLHVSINEGRGLSTHEPYVKMYISKEGKDIKKTKHKTKARESSRNQLIGFHRESAREH